jgi:hypothetical protein
MSMFRAGAVEQASGPDGDMTLKVGPREGSDHVDAARSTVEVK